MNVMSERKTPGISWRFGKWDGYVCAIVSLTVSQYHLTLFPPSQENLQKPEVPDVSGRKPSLIL